MEQGGLTALAPLLRSSDTEIVTAAVAALRNLSIHKGNEVRGVAVPLLSCSHVTKSLSLSLDLASHVTVPSALSSTACDQVT